MSTVQGLILLIERIGQLAHLVDGAVEPDDRLLSGVVLLRIEGFVVLHLLKRWSSNPPDHPQNPPGLGGFCNTLAPTRGFEPPTYRLGVLALNMPVVVP